jgi:hypothetical protein
MGEIDPARRMPSEEKRCSVRAAQVSATSLVHILCLLAEDLRVVRLGRDCNYLEGYLAAVESAIVNAIGMNGRLTWNLLSNLCVVSIDETFLE